MADERTQFLDIPSRSTRAVGRPSSRSTAFERRIAQRFLEDAGRPAIRFELWDGTAILADGAEPVGTVRVVSRRTFWRLFLNPLLNFGDDYARGTIEVDGDLVDVLHEIFSAQPRVEPGSGRRAGFKRWRRRFGRGSSRDNLHHHYDLGNDFYRLWLDEEMLYTCAYYASPDMNLEAAQRAKMEHVCRKLRLERGERVVEAGCGWGGLALHMAREHGVSVRAFNLSTQQVEYARERARAEGLEHLVEFVQDDYRNIDGRYDAFVSVGMLEHVGPPNYVQLGGVIDRCLTENGRGLIHSIGQNQPEPPAEWTERRIFPGAYAPTLREMMRVLEPYAFSVLDVENLRLHYARTLEHWLERYERHAVEVERRYDATFVRAWRLYLAASIASFTSGSLQLFQVVFARPRDNDVPMTREYLYGD